MEEGDHEPRRGRERAREGRGEGLFARAETIWYTRKSSIKKRARGRRNDPSEGFRRGEAPRRARRWLAVRHARGNTGGQRPGYPGAGGDTPSSRSRAPPRGFSAAPGSPARGTPPPRRQRPAPTRRRAARAAPRTAGNSFGRSPTDGGGGRGAGSSGVRGDGRGRTGRSRATRGSFAHLVLEPGVVLLANGVRVVREMRVAVIAVVPRHGGRLATRRAPGARRVTEGCGGTANLFLLGARKSVYVPAHAGVFLGSTSREYPSHVAVPSGLRYPHPSGYSSHRKRWPLPSPPSPRPPRSRPA